MADHQALLMNQDDEEGLGFGEEGPEAKNRLKNPVVAFFHLFFRAAAIIVYMFCGIFGSGFVQSFVFVVLLLSIDFWIVKNITGRILVGLRWWNYVDDEGKNYWVFESRKGIRAGGRPPERKVFWTGLVVAPVVWFLLFLSSFFTFRLQWTILVIIALVLNISNLYGYIRCKLGHRPGIADATGILQQGISSIILSKGTQPTTEPNDFKPSSFNVQSV